MEVTLDFQRATLAAKQSIALNVTSNIIRCAPLGSVFTQFLLKCWSFLKMCPSNNLSMKTFLYLCSLIE